MFDDEGRLGPPSRPHVIRWRAARLATIERDDEMLAILHLAPDAPEFEIHSEPPTQEGRALLFRSLVWAVEEYERRAAGGGSR
jgi:hypothetical protein